MRLAKWAAVLGLLAGLSACGGTLPTSPPVGDVRQDPVYVDSTDLLQLESFPVQVVLQVRGQLPDPCHEAVWTVSEPDPQGRIDVSLHSQAPQDLDCIQVLEPVSLRIPIGSFERGSFSIWLNGEQVGAFDL